MTHPTDRQRLENILAGLEELILRAPDREILALSNRRAGVEEVRGLIAEHTGGYAKEPSRRHATRIRSRLKETRSADRLAVLRRLVRTRPDLRPQLSAVLGSGKTPTQSEIEDLMELLRKSEAVSDNDDDRENDKE